jgi:hypothetical protein
MPEDRSLTETLKAAKRRRPPPGAVDHATESLTFASSEHKKDTKPDDGGQVRTCSECARSVDDDFRFCPSCGTALRSKIVEYFRGENEFGDGTLRVSVYLTQPQHVRLSIWKDEAARAALSLTAAEADRLLDFVAGLRVTRRRRFETSLRRSARALADSVGATTGARRRACSPPQSRG